jgi:nicotinamide mononucleotide transporter
MTNTPALKLSWFDWFLILGVTTTSIITSAFAENFDWLGLIINITGIINLVLCAKGNLINYFFGIIYNALYVYVAFSTKLYADSAIYLLYYLPMQFVGWANWKKNQSKESGAVITRRLTIKSAALLLAIAAVLVPLFAWILSLPAIGDAQPWADSATTVASIIAMYMMVKAYVEQWYIWLLLDLIQSVKWLIETIRGGEHAAMMLIMFLFFTANAIYGLIQWNRLEKSENNRK